MAPTIVPTLVASFAPGWTRTGSSITQAGTVLADSGHTVAWWHEGNVNGARVTLNVIDHATPTSPIFGAATAVEAVYPNTPGFSGLVRPVPGSQLLLMEGPSYNTISCLTWNAGTLALTTQTAYSLPGTDPNDAARTMGGGAAVTVIPISSTRAFIFSESVNLADATPRTRNLVWFLVALTSTGIGATIAFGSFAVGTATFVVVTAHRVDTTRVLLVLNDTADSVRVIQDTGTSATVGTAITGYNQPVSDAADGTFYAAFTAASALKRLTLSGTTITATTLVGSTTQPVAVVPFDSAYLLSLTTGVGVHVVDRVDGTMGPAGTGIPIPDVGANLPKLHLDVANAAAQLVYIATWAGATNAWYPMLHLAGVAPPVAVGGWGFGVRMNV